MVNAQTYVQNADGPVQVCVGVYYEGGYCMAYSAVSGTFEAPYGMAALRQ